MLKKLIKNHSDKIRFILVGGTNTVIDFGILFSLTNFTSLSIFYSNILSTSVALSFSFFANKKFTFKKNSTNSRLQFVRFLAITLVGLWIMLPLIISSTSSIFGNLLNDNNLILLAGKLFASCFTLIWNYLMYRKFVFKSGKI
jgi:putative flippase GtrA